MSKTEETPMDKVTTEMMEHLCDNLCRHPHDPELTQEELDDICTECKMGRYVCDMLNEYNRINDFEKTQSYKLLARIAELESKNV